MVRQLTNGYNVRPITTPEQYDNAITQINTNHNGLTLQDPSLPDQRAFQRFDNSGTPYLDFIEETREELRRRNQMFHCPLLLSMCTPGSSCLFMLCSTFNVVSAHFIPRLKNICDILLSWTASITWSGTSLFAVSCQSVRSLNVHSATSCSAIEVLHFSIFRISTYGRRKSLDSPRI